jgi:UDP-N-acetylmuramoyl-L-alanyl-D-glutamate--2,6-diaminopimelate ligase
VLLLLGLGLETALEKLSQLHTVPGRMERFGGTAQQPLVVVDYAHTPDALEQVLATLRDHCNAKLWCVFGCGGDRDTGKRPQMGGIAARYADHIILTDDNPRHEDPAAIINDIAAGIKGGEFKVLSDRAEAIDYAITQAAANDVVLVAGKGHEDYQQVGDEKSHFSDSEQVRRALGVAA